jgi:hypothetical protein
LRKERVIRTSWFRCRNLPKFAQGKNEKNAFGYYALTQKEERGKGLHQWAVLKVQQKLKKEGFDRLFISTSFEETVAQYCLHKMGFEVVGKLYGIKIFGRKYFWHRR